MTGIGRIFSFQRIPIQAIIITAAVSYLCQLGGVIQGWPLWALVLATLLPWIPLFFFEAVWKHEHYGAFAVFMVIALLQVGHLAEHSAQVFQLAVLKLPLICPPPPGANPNNFACGVFGFLDFETVHFVWDTAVWLGTLMLVFVFGTRNPWLMISLFAASAHEVEHMFLFYIFTYANDFYEAGGKAGILGQGGYLPLAWRPYLHFGYNTVVVVPLVIALFVELRRVYDEYLAKALPRLTEQQLVETSGRLRELHFEPGAIIVRQGDHADKFFIITRGEVEVIRENPGDRDFVVARLGPGQFFGEIGLLMGARRTATVRAVTDTEVLYLDKHTFRNVVANSEPTHMELDLIVRQRLSEMEGIAGMMVTPGWTPARLCRMDSREEIPLEADVEVLGRSRSNSIVVADPSVSRRHAMIQQQNGTYWLEDLGGANGTWVNEQQVERHPLQDGDTIRIGNTQYTFRTSAQRAAAGHQAAAGVTR